MEKWARSLSKTTALIFGVVGILVVIIIGSIAYDAIGGLIGVIFLGALLGGGIGFSLPLLIKGFTGLTPQEKKELAQRGQLLK